MNKVGLDITKKNFKDYINKTVLVITKPEEVQKKKGLKINVSFSWEKRNNYYGYSGCSGYGFRHGNLEPVEKIRFLKISSSGECVLVEEYGWGYSSDYKEYSKEKWYTIDSLLDVYYFIEILE